MGASGAGRHTGVPRMGTGAPVVIFYRNGRRTSVCAADKFGSHDHAYLRRITGGTGDSGGRLQRVTGRPRGSMALVTAGVVCESGGRLFSGAARGYLQTVPGTGLAAAARRRGLPRPRDLRRTPEMLLVE